MMDLKKEVRIDRERPRKFMTTSLNLEKNKNCATGLPSYVSRGLQKDPIRLIFSEFDRGDFRLCFGVVSEFGGGRSQLWENVAIGRKLHPCP